MNLPTCSCPHCGNAIPTQNIVQDRKTGEARGRCFRCNKWISIPIPSIRKKLVYLDQSFLSAACLEADDPKSKTVVAIFSKIRQLREQQKIYVVVSDIHSRETSAISDEHIEKRKRLWKFQNDLADGNISTSWHDVFVAQQRRVLVDPGDSESFPVSDIGLENLHQLQVGMRIQLTNHWRPKLDAANARLRPEVNEGFRQIIERQLEAIPRCEDARDCLNFVRELWRKNIREGIAAWRQSRDLRAFVEKELDAGRVPDFTRLEPPDAPFRRFIGEVVHGLDEESALQRWLQLIEGDSTNWCTALRIRIAFEAALLWKWRTGRRPTNPDTFNEGFGLSRQNDIDHVSAFVPYVDALTTDKNMLNFCKQEIVAGELAQFLCKIFATTNYNDFEAWLDALLAVSDD
jgi:hypothetical protein